MYANYDFYRTCYKGNLIDEKDYDRVAGRAADIISCATLGRSDGVLSDTVMHRVKRLNCALAEVMHNQETAETAVFSTDGGAVSSESVGSWSRSYGANSAIAAQVQSVEDRQKRLIAQYLCGTGLLYGGIG